MVEKQRYYNCNNHLKHSLIFEYDNEGKRIKTICKERPENSSIRQYGDDGLLKIVSLIIAVTPL
ncbi:hypothetical protein AGMMS50267_11050 [Spirochaetia bacterium]|nr:hypothetical protein AGMMS50267_11050 [Spirochaetia bacterium]